MSMMRSARFFCFMFHSLFLFCIHERDVTARRVRFSPPSRLRYVREKKISIFASLYVVMLVFLHIDTQSHSAAILYVRCYVVLLLHDIEMFVCNIACMLSKGSAQCALNVMKKDSIDGDCIMRKGNTSRQHFSSADGRYSFALESMLREAAAKFRNELNLYL